LPRIKSKSEEKPQRNFTEIAANFAGISTLPAHASQREPAMIRKTLQSGSIETVITASGAGTTGIVNAAENSEKPGLARPGFPGLRGGLYSPPNSISRMMRVSGIPNNHKRIGIVSLLR
jgi:hypothetical protein